MRRETTQKFYACSLGSKHKNSLRALQEEGPRIKILCVLPRDKILRAPTQYNTVHYITIQYNTVHYSAAYQQNNNFEYKNEFLDPKNLEIDI